MFSLAPVTPVISALAFQKNSHWGTGVASKVLGFISADEKAEVGSAFPPQKVARLSEKHRETPALGLGFLVNSFYFPYHQSALSSQCCDKRLDQKQLGKKRVYFTSQFCVTAHLLWKSGQELEAGTEAEVVEEHCLRACSPWLAQSAFLHYLGPRARAATPAGWALPHHSSTKKMPYSLVYRQADGGIFSTNIPLKSEVLLWAANQLPNENIETSY